MQTPEEIISDAEIDEFHSATWRPDANRRGIVAKGVLKAAFGYGSGSTVIAILRAHNLIEPQRTYTGVAELTAKGKLYLRATWNGKFDEIMAIAGYGE